MLEIAVFLWHEKGAFGHGKRAFRAWKGHTDYVEQGLEAMGRPKSKILIFIWFYTVYPVFRRVDLEHGRASLFTKKGPEQPQELS